MKNHDNGWMHRALIAAVSGAGLLSVLAAALRADSDSGGEARSGPERAVAQTASETSVPVASGDTLEVSLDLRDTDDNPFSGTVSAAVMADFTEEVYFLEARVSGGRATIEFELTGEDYAALAEGTESCGFILCLADAPRFPLEGPGAYLDASEGKAVILGSLSVSEVTVEQQSKLVATVAARFSLPSLYGSVVLSERSRPGQALRLLAIDSDGDPIPMVGPVRGLENLLLSLEAGASSVDLYSWSVEPAMGVELFRESGNKAGPTAVLHRQRTVVAPNAVPIVIDVIVDRALHPTATRLLVFDGEGYSPTADGDIADAFGRLERTKEAVLSRSLNTRNAVSLEHLPGSYAMELWGLQQDPRTGLFVGQVLDSRAPTYIDRDCTVTFD